MRFYQILKEGKNLTDGYQKQITIITVILFMNLNIK